LADVYCGQTVAQLSTAEMGDQNQNQFVTRR